MHSIMRNKSPRSSVLVIDDHSTEYKPMWLRNTWGVRVHRPAVKQPIGHCFKIALEQFLLSQSQVWISFPNDCVVAPGFDLKVVKILRHGGEPKNSIAVCYNSICHPVTPIDGNNLYGLSSVTGGIGMCMSRTTAKWFSRIMKDKWGWLYDWEMSKHLGQIRVPLKSLAEHTGANQKDALHPDSNDVAVDFVGEGK